MFENHKPHCHKTAAAPFFQSKTIFLPRLVACLDGQTAPGVGGCSRQEPGDHTLPLTRVASEESKARAAARWGRLEHRLPECHPDTAHFTSGCVLGELLEGKQQGLNAQGCCDPTELRGGGLGSVACHCLRLGVSSSPLGWDARALGLFSDRDAGLLQKCTPDRLGPESLLSKQVCAFAA